MFFHCIVKCFRWVEQDPLLILSSVVKCIDKAVENLRALNIDVKNIKSKYANNSYFTPLMYDKFSIKITLPITLKKH